MPPWADLDKKGPGPADDPNRFKSFRTHLGKFVASGNRHNLEAALGSYASRTLGGAQTGTRRLAPMVAAGGTLMAMLSDLRSGGDGSGPTGVDLSSLRGLDIKTAIQRIVEQLAPENGDRELVRAALNEALTICLGDQAEFDPDTLTDDLLMGMLIEYLIQSVFVHIVYESGEAFDKTTDAEKGIKAEQDLLELIKVVVDEQAGPVLANPQPLTQANAQSIQTKIIAAVLTVWEGYQ